MKKTVLILVALVLMAGTATADMAHDSKLIDIMAPSGTSYFVIDINREKWDNISAGLAGSITQGVAGSGTTLTFLAAGVNEKPTDLQLAGASPFPALDWRMIFNKLDLSSGATEYMHPVDIPAARWLVGKVIGGVTNITCKLDFISREGSWSPPSPIVISEGVFTIPSTGSGVSTLTVPDGTRYAEFSISGASLFYTSDGLTTPSISGNGTGIHCADLEGFSLTGNEARNAKFAKGGASRNVYYKFLTGKP